MASRERLIDELTSDVRPAPRLRAPFSLCACWWTASWIAVTGVALWVFPMRDGAGAQLLASPRFAFECLLGLAAGLVAIRMAFELGVPGDGSPHRRVAIALGALTLWAGAYVVGLAYPALEPSSVGMRPFCRNEVLLYGVPALVAGLCLLRRLAPLRRAWTGVVVGAAAAAIPALLMQVACMYVPEHILLSHLAPIALVAALGACLGPLVLRRI